MPLSGYYPALVGPNACCVHLAEFAIALYPENPAMNVIPTSTLKSPGLSPPVVNSPYFWQLLQWTFWPVEFLDRCAARYGDCFAVRISKNQPFWVFISDPQMVAEVFAAAAGQMDTGRASRQVRYSMGEYSTLVLDGKPHQRHRKLLMPPFHGERMKAYGHEICDITTQMTCHWTPGTALTMLPVMNDITLQVILKTVFGLYSGERYEQIKLYLRQFLAVFGHPLFYPLSFFPGLLKDRGPWRPVENFMRMRRPIDDLLFAEIRERRQNFDPNQPDILTLLMAARDEDGQPLSDQELRDELMTMLPAGHDSSASTLAWAFYYIHSHPAVKTKLLAELDTLGDQPEPMAIARLPYLSAVCSESMRLRSAGPTIQCRITNGPMQIGPYEFPVNTMLIPSNYLTHHREDLYPEPQQFRPERFLERQYTPYEYYPFGGGNRYCIGAAFAQFEMKLVLATILKRYQLALRDKRPIKAIRRGVNISPQGGVKMTVRALRPV
ncbi:cytochrome P450 [Leptolyngbya sp. 7M]|uniref:cytochrome P450 n=1 Tax=Leptolyngbya sp. 7M TaxID=2812896 RepID=UPI001B8D7047|nr:cytochrome P450 [Leptolyngbya sp. 7M]QYO62380.1 cytochrome P450 [Leptolyngbya sp. 7M]